MDKWHQWRDRKHRPTGATDGVRAHQESHISGAFATPIRNATTSTPVQAKANGPTVKSPHPSCPPAPLLLDKAHALPDGQDEEHKSAKKDYWQLAFQDLQRENSSIREQLAQCKMRPRWKTEMTCQPSCSMRLRKTVRRSKQRDRESGLAREKSSYASSSIDSLTRSCCSKMLVVLQRASIRFMQGCRLPAFVCSSRQVSPHRSPLRQASLMNAYMATADSALRTRGRTIIFPILVAVSHRIGSPFLLTLCSAVSMYAILAIVESDRQSQPREAAQCFAMHRSLGRLALSYIDKP